MFYRFLLGAAALLILMVTNNACMAAGATALGEPADIAKDGVAIFTQVNAVDSKTAKEQALAGCKGLSNASDTSKALCKVVATFENQCVAQALDPQSGTPGFGWAMASDPKAAREQALSNCRDTAGPTRQDACIVDDRSLWCDGSAAKAAAATPAAPNKMADEPPKRTGPPARDQIEDIQSRLYELNYDITVTGTWDEWTKASVKDWHETTKRPNPGTMSDDDIAYLHTATPNKIWGGVVFDARGHYRLFTNETSRKELVDKEISYCKAHFESKSCGLHRILSATSSDNGCIGVSHADWRVGRTNKWATYVVTRPGIDRAKDDVIGNCVSETGTSRSTCKLVAAVCTDGSSQTGALERRP
jgi:hypothetical protein